MSTTTLITVHGMTCGACVATVTSALEGIEGVTNASVSLVTEEAMVKHSPQVAADILIEAVEDCGFEAKLIKSECESQGNTAKAQQTVFKVLGMTCGSCTATIERELGKVEGVQSVAVSLTMEEATVVYEPLLVGVRDIIEHIEDLGFEGMVSSGLDTSAQLRQLSKTEEIEFWKKSLIISGTLGFIVMSFEMWIPMIEGGHKGYPKMFPYIEIGHGLWLNSVLTLIPTAYVQFVLGKYFYKAAWSSLKHMSGTMDTLVCISTTCAFVFSIFSIIRSMVMNIHTAPPPCLFDTSTMLVTFISLGKWLENRAKSQTSMALSKLISLAPTTCTLVKGKFDSLHIQNLNTTQIPLDLLQINDVVEMKPGSKIPADGVIIYGETSVDESLLTGESLPVHKSSGDKVIGGSVTGSGLCYVKVTQIGENTQLSKIISAVKNAQVKKASVQQLADTLAGWFVPCVVLLAGVTFVWWFVISRVLKNPPMLFTSNPHGRFFVCIQVAISVVVVACPCALGLAAPTAVITGTGVASENGILIKGGDILEKASNLDVFLFDKTGTLTMGKMCVKKFHVEEEFDEIKVMDIVGSVEHASEHPVAKAVVDHVEGSFQRPLETNVLSSEIVVGKGVRAEVEYQGAKHHVVVGNKTLMSDDLIIPESSLTVSYISIDGVCCGYVEVSDMLKNDAAEVVTYLKDIFGAHVAMVSGDSTQAARSIAHSIGIESVYAEVSPLEKEQIVANLQAKGMRVAFVGDGINDSPALATADLGIAIASGTDIAIEAADIVLMSGDSNRNLKGIINAIDIATKTFKRIKLNFFWAMCYNMIMLPIAMGVLLPWGISLHPMAAGAAMMMSSLSVVISSLMLKKWKSPMPDQSVENTPNFFNRILGRNKTRLSDDIELQAGLLH